MMADPEPVQAFRAFLGDGAIMDGHAHRPEFTRLVQPQRRMPGILFEQFEIFFRQPLDLFRQSAEMPPEFRRGEMRHSGRHLPCSNARSAASPSLSNLPACTSAAKRFSHFSAIK